MNRKHRRAGLSTTHGEESARKAAQNLKNASAYLRAGRFDQAVAAYQTILAIVPDSYPAWVGLGSALLAQGRGEEALSHFARAASLWPLDAKLQERIAAAFHAVGRFAEACQSALKAIALDPSSAEAQARLARVLAVIGQPQEAEKAARRAIQLDPNCGVAHESLALALARLGRDADARAARRRSLALDPDPTVQLRDILAVPPISGSVEEIAATRARVIEGIASLRAQGSRRLDPIEADARPFFLAYHGLNDRRIQESLAALYLAARPSLGIAAPHIGSGGGSGPRIRLGIISAFLRTHTIGRLYGGLIEHLSRERFERVLFRPPVTDDDIGQRVDRAVDRVVIMEFDHRRIVEAMAAAQLDILFFPDVGMSLSSYFVGFARLAPVQLVTWGHPVTTGIPNMDYFLSSEDLEIAEADAHYSERLVRFKNLLPYYYRPATPEPGDLRARLELPDDASLYVCPQSLFKFHPTFDPILGAILRRDPKGLLLLLGGQVPGWEEQLLKRFGTCFPDALDRVRFVPRMNREDFLRLFMLADVVLDPPPFGGGNSSYEALAMGAPIVTWPSHLLAGRITYALYRSMGMEDLVARDAGEYIDLANRLATDSEFRTMMVGRIRERSGVLFENSAGILEFEAFACNALTGTGIKKDVIE